MIDRREGGAAVNIRNHDWELIGIVFGAVLLVFGVVSTVVLIWP